MIRHDAFSQQQNDSTEDQIKEAVDDLLGNKDPTTELILSAGECQM